MPAEAPAYLIVIGTSAGGMPALTQLVAQLPATLPAAVLVVQHLSPDSTGAPLVARLNAHTELVCQLATNRAALLEGNLYLAPAGHHLLVKEDHLLVTTGPHENSFRPSADALFRSAAVAFWLTTSASARPRGPHTELMAGMLGVGAAPWPASDHALTSESLAETVSSASCRAGGRWPMPDRSTWSSSLVP